MTLAASPAEITHLLHASIAGDTAAMDEALQRMYQSLHQLANQQLRGENDPMLSATALVNEAYLRVFADSTPPPWENRGHLLGVAAHAMRQVLIDHARKRKAAKRPQDHDRMQLTEIADLLAARVEPEQLGDALDRLAQLDPRQARIVDMRFFVGLSGEQISAALGLSTATVQREWRMARAWLARELEVA